MNCYWLEVPTIQRGRISHCFWATASTMCQFIFWIYCSDLQFRPQRLTESHLCNYHNSVLVCSVFRWTDSLKRQMRRNDSEFCYVHSSGYPQANYCMSLGSSVAFQARPCAPTTWRTSPQLSLAVSRSRSHQSRPGHPYLKRKFPSPGNHQCFFCYCLFCLSQTSQKHVGSSLLSANR